MADSPLRVFLLNRPSLQHYTSSLLAMATRYKSTFYITLLVASTVCLTSSVDDGLVGAVTRQSKKFLLGVVEHHPYYAYQPLASRFWGGWGGTFPDQTSLPAVGVSGLPNKPVHRPHSIMSGSSNYFGIFPAFSGNHNCPPPPSASTCTTCPAAPPNKEDITTCGGASASPNGTIKIDRSSSISGNGICNYALVTFKPFTKIQFQCDDLSGGTVTLRTPDSKETVLYSGRRIYIIDYGWVLIIIIYKDRKEAILEEADARQTGSIACSWTAA